MYCSKCGKQIEDNSKFCMYCGEKNNVVYDNLKTKESKNIIKEKELIILDNSKPSTKQNPKKKSTNKIPIIITIVIALFVVFILLGVILALIIALFINDNKTADSFIDSDFQESSSTNNNFWTDFEESEYIENNNDNTDTDMVYTYDNGRLTTTVGSADVYYNGEHYNGVATFIPNPNYNTDIFRIKDFYRDLEFSLTSYNNYIMTGDSYTKDNLIELADSDKVRLSLDNFPIEYDGWETISLSSLYSAKYYFDDAVIDIINYDEAGVTVIYFYYTFHDDDGNHYEVEALGAAELSEAIIQNTSSESTDYSISTPSVCNICHGTGVCQVCYGRGGVSYTTWGQGGDGWVECTGCHGDRSCQYCD